VIGCVAERSSGAGGCRDRGVAIALARRSRASEAEAIASEISFPRMGRPPPGVRRAMLAKRVRDAVAGARESRLIAELDDRSRLQLARRDAGALRADERSLRDQSCSSEAGTTSATPLALAQASSALLRRLEWGALARVETCLRPPHVHHEATNT
jgi:hypothetical protein